MKKVILLLSIVATILLSCKKEETPDTTPKTVCTTCTCTYYDGSTPYTATPYCSTQQSCTDYITAMYEYNDSYSYWTCTNPQ